MLNKDAEQSWNLLMEGNKRFVSNSVREFRVDMDHFKNIIKGQKPYATIVACSDSRVTLERIFDVSQGEIFEIKTAGNVVDDIAIGSIEYGVGHLKTPLLLIMGHTYCGAVTAAVKGEHVNGYLSHIIDKIRLSFKTPETGNEDLVNVAIKKNVESVMLEVYKKSKTVREAVDGNETALFGAIFEMENGHVKKYCMLKEGKINYF